MSTLIFSHMTVHIITIGDELLIGQVIDTNSARMAQYLQTIGAQVTGRTTVGDVESDMLEAFKVATEKADVVLVTGGLGPTNDDLTIKVLTQFYGTELIFHQPTLDHIERMFKRFGRTVPEGVKTQAYLPENCTVLHNKMGTAPGMWFDVNGKVLVSTPGVPSEMAYLMEHEIVPRLKERFPGMPIDHRTVLTIGEGESQISERIADFEKNLPTGISLAYLPGISQVRLRLTASGEGLENILDEKFAELQTLLPKKLIAGFGKDTLEVALGKLLKEKGLTLAIAESCTGGYVSHLVTSVSGSSSCFVGSVVSYANEVKTNQLGVKTETLKAHGAVSEQTVQEMVSGALELLGTDLAVATSGIAGPTGGTPEKPVGTIWIAVGNKERTVTQKLSLGKDRMRNIQYTAKRALNAVRLFAEGQI